MRARLAADGRVDPCHLRGDGERARPGCPGLATDDDLAAKTADATKGRKASGDPIASPGAGLAHLDVPLRDGRCGTAVVTLTGGTFAPGVTWTLGLPGGGHATTTASTSSTGAVVDLQCSDKGGMVTLQAHPPPVGQATVQVYDRRAHDADWSPANLESWLVGELSGYQPLGSPPKGVLESPSVEKYTFEKGKCYKLVMRLGASAVLSRATVANNVDFEFEGADEDLSAGPGLHGPGALSDVGCRRSTEAMTMHLQTYGGSLGTGPYQLQLWVRDASQGDLQQVAADEKASEDDFAKWQAQHRREVCGDCAEQKADCERRADGGDCNYTFEACVRSQDGTNDDPYEYCY